MVSLIVIAGLDPAIHLEDVDDRDEPGHDAALLIWTPASAGVTVTMQRS